MSYAGQQEQPDLDAPAWDDRLHRPQAETSARLAADNARLRNAMHAALGLYQTSHIHGLLRITLRG